MVEFDAAAKVKIIGLEEGEIQFKRENRVITATGEIPVNLKKGMFTGNLTIIYNGNSFLGQGKIGYRSEKFSGEVILQIMDANEANSLKDKTAAGGVPQLEPLASSTPSVQDAAVMTGANKDGKPTGNISKKKPDKCAIVGQGDLNFEFTAWLKGNAHVFVDPKGDITVVGAITPAKQITLFEEKPFGKDLAKFEAKAAYGFPVIGNVGVYAAIDIYLWAQLGPGILKDIKAQGTYSTDPTVRQNYSLRGQI